MFTITCGRFPNVPSDEGKDLMTFTLASVAEVQDAARAFITVFPADIDDEKADIAAWDGNGPLSLSHQDDDYFIFRVHPVGVPSLPTSFGDFVDEWQVSDDEEEDEED